MAGGRGGEVSAAGGNPGLVALERLWLSLWPSTSPQPTSCLADAGGKPVPQRLPGTPRPRAWGVSTLYDGAPTAWSPGRWGLPRELGQGTEGRMAGLVPGLGHPLGSCLQVCREPRNLAPERMEGRVR